jgi:cytochrome c peroxidase
MRVPLATACFVSAIVLAGVVVRPRGPRQDPGEPAHRDAVDVAFRDLASEPIRPIPPGKPLDEAIVELGRKLFYETRLSADGSISCAACHDLERAGADGRRVSIGVGGAVGERNAPTVLNSSLNIWQFWDGRAETLEEQAGWPLTHPKEMGMTWPAILEVLSGDPDYDASFREIWPEGVTERHVRAALATFERALLTPGSPFDRYLQGETDAITADEKRGYELFLEVGCITCHQGVNVGGNLFQRFGIASNFFEDRGTITESDLGRYNVTKRESDTFKFRVPSLRNVSRTAPYFHDGSVQTLEQAIVIMALYQLGAQIDDEEVRLIAAFLGTLDGTEEE